MIQRLLPIALLALVLAAQPAPPPRPAPPSPAAGQSNAEVLKAIDDVMWHLLLDDIAVVDKVALPSLPLAHEKNPTAQGAGNPLVIPAYTYVPRKLDRTKKQPLLVYVHGGVHANHQSGGASSTAHILRELLEQGYSIVAPEYRGSTGYGRDFYDAIDYGGRENDDVLAARDWMLESYDFLDAKRVGILGWSHGGMITLMNIFEHPNAYAVAYAGVPVSDLVARMGYKSDSYRRIFSEHIGKNAEDDVKEYLRRSPVSHAARLNTPLLIHTNTSDEDVNVLEVQRLISALKAEGRKFEYRIYQDAPGGHHFNRIDSKLARESRQDVWRFLARYLGPANPPRP